MTRAEKIEEALKLTVGHDGFWLHAKHGSKEAAVNLPSMAAHGSVYEVLMALATDLRLPPDTAPAPLMTEAMGHAIRIAREEGERTGWRGVWKDAMDRAAEEVITQGNTDDPKAEKVARIVRNLTPEFCGYAPASPPKGTPPDYPCTSCGAMASVHPAPGSSGIVCGVPAPPSPRESAAEVPCPVCVHEKCKGSCKCKLCKGRGTVPGGER